MMKTLASHASLGGVLVENHAQRFLHLLIVVGIVFAARSTVQRYQWQIITMKKGFVRGKRPITFGKILVVGMNGIGPKGIARWQIRDAALNTIMDGVLPSKPIQVLRAGDAVRDDGTIWMCHTQGIGVWNDTANFVSKFW
eukprot:scaffold1115_cov165-Amphora_coffeaeformis.AAC.2